MKVLTGVIMIIPPAVLINKERVTGREILSDIMAVCGVVMFFIW
jgi:drug/metabolite transporter (DMT)-like permease